jgi:hypothetical protein
LVALANTRVPAVVAAPNHGVLLASGLQGTIGSTIGPDGALYVAEGAAGKISRIDPATGAVTTFASGLPKTIPAVGIGGAMDIAFIGDTAYALVTLVGPDVGGNDKVGIYRVDGPSSFSVIADIGEWSIAHPPKPAFFVASGLQYAFERYGNGFLVTDGHHNRMLDVSLIGEISELIAFENIVPTGLLVAGTNVYMAEAGPVPHRPENGRVLVVDAEAASATVIAAGASLLVDVEGGPGGGIYALSQGPGVPGAPEGAPAQADSGALVKVNADGTLTFVVDKLDLPASVNFVGDTAYVVTLNGEVWKIDGVSQLAAGGPTAPISPPSAGDAGLLDQQGTGLMTLVIVLLTVVGFSTLAWRRAGKQA